MKVPAFLFAITCLSLALSCGSPEKNNRSVEGRDSLSGQLVIFHAGSLSVPVKQICDSFTKVHPGVNILTEAAGSKECARKISELGKRCDIMLSSDYAVIEEMLMPDYAKWCLQFATNEMAVVYQPESKYADRIDSLNWLKILAGKDVRIARSDPDSDPCGVRAVFCIRLAGMHYKSMALSEALLAKDHRFIRPKETDLIALLETRTVDYIFLYRSVAMQHNLPYLILPDAVNLKNSRYAEFYGKAELISKGRKPGETIVEKGAPMVYGLCIPSGAPDSALAVEFLDFFLNTNAGMKIMENNGQPPLMHGLCKGYENMPEALKKYAQKP